MSEKTPLFHYRFNGGSTAQPYHEPGTSAANAGGDSRKLGVLFGVVVPTLLSMFSVVVFLRIGFVVGQAGLYQSIAMFLVAYLIVTMTVLSVCAICTNGALEAGGAYHMISRALGPEFGGSIGVMFYFANICCSALYILGLVEAIVSAFGIPNGGVAAVSGGHQVLPSGYWWSMLYATVLLFLCFIVCLVGAHIYAKTTFIVFIVVLLVLGSIFISFFSVGPRVVALPPSAVFNSTAQTVANYTGIRLRTLKGNLLPSYTVDYTTGAIMNFVKVFAVMFNGCTGIMAGSNMSGDLRNPSFSIPRGTFAAVFTTFVTYNLLSLLAAASCDRCLLQRNYSFLGDINVWPPLVTIGVYLSSISASMSNLIGASRILYALSRDNLFGGRLTVATKTSRSGNPWASVLISWLLVQMVLFAGKLNTIASIVTISFLLVYAAINMSCLALEWASASNFRPSFRFFKWYTCLLGGLGCLCMMFLIDAFYAFASIAFMLMLLMLIQCLGPGSKWGFISQALIFHQVRKYLLMLDVRKDHVRFWRPQLLLAVANPRSCTALMSFINDFKKSGLYVLGHVQLGLLDGLPSDPLQSTYESWLSLVDHLNIKAFVNLTLASTVRQGVQNLLFISGFGAMRPNTLVMGFYDDCTPQDDLQGKVLLSTGYGLDSVDSSVDITQQRPASFPDVRGAEDPKDLHKEEYVSVIADALKMGKNVTLGRYFNQFDREKVLRPGEGDGCGSSAGPFIDLWPLNLLRPDSRGYVDTCSLFLLQMAAVLHETHAWSRVRLRIFLCLEARGSLKEQEKNDERRLQAMLAELRITATVHMVEWDEVVALHWQRREAAEMCMGGSSNNNNEADRTGRNAWMGDREEALPTNVSLITEEYLRAVNDLLRQHGAPQPAMRFLYLPRPPADTRRYGTYLQHMELLSRGLGPTMLIHGVTPVVTTDL